MFDHVGMGYPIAGRPPGPYPPQMPILEALMALSYMAAVTSRVTLGPEVLGLPQRDPTMVAKQVSTLDTLSGGRVRLGVGVGWQESEYEALGEDFHTRGARMDEAIRLLRTCWSDPQIDFKGRHYQITAIGMEPKPPQGSRLPIWIGGRSERALRRVGELGDGWLGNQLADAESARAAIATIRRHAEAAGRDPASIGLQAMGASPPRDAAGKKVYSGHERVVAPAAGSTSTTRSSSRRRSTASTSRCRRTTTAAGDSARRRSSCGARRSSVRPSYHQFIAVRCAPGSS